jgi:hypothetical protein
MDTQQLEIQEIEYQKQGREFLRLFIGLKWAIIVFCISVATSLLVAPWFLFLGTFLCIGLVVSDDRVSSYFTKQVSKILDSEYDDIEEVFADIKSQLSPQYVQLLTQGMEIYREIKVAIRDRNGIFAESFGDVFPAIQALMDKILQLARKAQIIDNGLRCHDDVEHTRMVLEHYQQKIERDIADDFIKSEWIRTRDSLIKQLKSQEEIQRGKE